MATRFDLICMGRASLDLFSQDVGAPFEDIRGFHVFVGGTPVNIVVGAQRLGLQTAMLTGGSDDGVGRLVQKFLAREGVNTDFITPKQDKRVNAFLLAIEPPNKFESVAYQADNADLWLDIDDVMRAPVDACRALLFTGMGVLTPTNHSATLAAAERAHVGGAQVYMDIDYKAHQWADPRMFGVFARGVLRLVDVAIGTEEEICAAAGVDDPQEAAARLLALVRVAVVQKRGVHGATAYLKDGTTLDAPRFQVEVLNVFGAGDAFAAGLIYGRTCGKDWAESLRLAAACGALIVTRHGCANDMPTLPELTRFIAQQHP